jgi:hypothetical protein
MADKIAAPLADILDRLRGCDWVDLTHAFGPGIPHYSAFPDEEREVVFHFDEGVGSGGTGFLATATATSGSEAPTSIRPPTSLAVAGPWTSCR